MESYEKQLYEMVKKQDLMLLRFERLLDHLGVGEKDSNMEDVLDACWDLREKCAQLLKDLYE